MNRIPIFGIVLSGLLSCALLGSCTRPLPLVVGTYGHNLYEVDFFPDGSFGPLKAIPSENPSFVIREGAGHYFAVSENDPYSGVYSYSESAVTAFSDHSDFCPCHLLRVGDMIYTADYGKGSISAFPVLDGVVQARSGVIHYDCSGPDPVRQTHSHIHQLRMIPDGICRKLGLVGEWMLASDLGGDVIHVLSRNDGAELQDCPELAIKLAPGTGPRHMEFNPDANMLYCITELGGMVYAIDISSEDGKPRFETLQTLKADQVDAGGSADIHLHPSGKFLYTSHRLDNDGIAVFDVREDGTLELSSYRETGLHPRNFAITPDGKYMLVACRDSYCIQVFAINPKDGTLSAEPLNTLHFDTDQPVCIAF